MTILILPPLPSEGVPVTDRNGYYPILKFSKVALEASFLKISRDFLDKSLEHPRGYPEEILVAYPPGYPRGILRGSSGHPWGIPGGSSGQPRGINLRPIHLLISKILNNLVIKSEVK